MSLWLFNIHIDCVVREANAKMLGKGLSLVNADDRVESESVLVGLDGFIISKWMQVQILAFIKSSWWW